MPGFQVFLIGGFEVGSRVECSRCYGCEGGVAILGKWLMEAASVRGVGGGVAVVRCEVMPEGFE